MTSLLCDWLALWVCKRRNHKELDVIESLFLHITLKQQPCKDGCHNFRRALITSIRWCKTMLYDIKICNHSGDYFQIFKHHDECENTLSPDWSPEVREIDAFSFSLLSVDIILPGSPRHQPIIVCCSFRLLQPDLELFSLSLFPSAYVSFPPLPLVYTQTILFTSHCAMPSICVLCNRASCHW